MSKQTMRIAALVAKLAQVGKFAPKEPVSCLARRACSTATIHALIRKKTVFTAGCVMLSVPKEKCATQGSANFSVHKGLISAARCARNCKMIAPTAVLAGWLAKMVSCVPMALVLCHALVRRLSAVVLVSIFKVMMQTVVLVPPVVVAERAVWRGLVHVPQAKQTAVAYAWIPRTVGHIVVLAIWHVRQVNFVQTAHA